MRKILILAIITMLNLANGAELQGKYGCDGDHKFDIFVRDAGYSYSEVRTDNHGKGTCFYYDKFHRKLMQCSGCNAQIVIEEYEGQVHSNR